MATPITPGLHDLVFWRGAKWLVTRVMRFGRVEISAVHEPTIQWVCLASQLSWQPKSNAWICDAYLIPLRGEHRCED